MAVCRGCKKVRRGFTPPDHPFNTLLRAWGAAIQEYIHHRWMVGRKAQKAAAHHLVGSACDLPGVVVGLEVDEVGLEVRQVTKQ